MKRIILMFMVMMFTGLCFAQTTATTLDRAINDAVMYIEGRLKNGSKLVILNMSTSQVRLSDYIIDEIATNMVNNNKLIVVDRRNLELIQREMNFQMSGEVSEETAQEIGRKLGAQYIISGSLTPLGNVYRLRVQVLSVETAQIAGMQNLNVLGNDRVITALVPGEGGEERKTGGTNVAAVSQNLGTLIYDDPGTKPEKKVPARNGNFEITQGKQLRVPINMDKFYAAAKTSLEKLKYEVNLEGTGYILFSVKGRNWWVQIRLCYWQDEYWYEYINSDNLGANPARDKIHKNYGDWIARLDKQLKAAYGR